MKNKNSILVVIIASIALMLLAGCFLIFSKQEPGEEKVFLQSFGDEKKMSEKEAEKISVEGFTNEQHPNSLLNLINKELDGEDFQVGRVLARNALYTRYFISYKSDGLKISGIMNVPAGSGPFPVLILNHGYIDPVIYTNGRGLKREQDYFARNGYVVVHPDYRGHGESDPDPEVSDALGLGYFGYTSDVLNLILALQKSAPPFLNMEKLGMLGHSMGGGVTMNVLVARPQLVDAGVLLAPVSSDYQKNFLRFRRDDISPEDRSRIASALGGVEESDNFLAFSSAPYFERVTAPVMIHHGTADTDVPVAWSYETEEKLRSAGKEVSFFEYPGEPHEFNRAWTEVMERSLKFFNDNLE